MFSNTVFPILALKNQNSDLRSQTSVKTQPRVLALSSGGGHWVQLLRLRPAFKGCDVTYATVGRGYEPEIEGAKFRAVIDSNRDQKLKLILSFFSIAWLILTKRPHTIVSTGAAPGFFAIFIGRLLGKKTIWVDSIANAEELSMSGQKAGKYATHWLTQWEHLAKPEGPHYFGNVLGNASASPNSEIRSQKSEVNSQNSDLQANPSNLSPQSLDNGSQVSVKRSAISDRNKFRIFVTVGTDQHFDRMVKIIDKWAANNPHKEIFAQIGETRHQPTHLNYSRFLSPQEFVEQIKSASLIIGHAGMGTILTALKHQKPILVMPKLAKLGEHRNEHQTATAKYLSDQGKINVAFDEHALVAKLNNLKELTATDSVGAYANTTLTEKLSAFRQN
jgi:UDP-N-acetylglucosamine transferase subunit ALG13